LFNLIFII
jgi:hypothetical protein